jgi:hypothetical protein
MADAFISVTIDYCAEDFEKLCLTLEPD